MTTTPPGKGHSERPSRRPIGPAFLLAQVGAHAAVEFARRIADLNLTPPQAGLLRLVAHEPGRNQQALAAQLGVVPSKVVVLVDALEGRRLLERRRSITDRRHYALHLTGAGEQILDDLRPVAQQHEIDLTAALDDVERDQLAGLLRRIADQQGLTPGVHPGYRYLAPPAEPTTHD